MVSCFTASCTFSWHMRICMLEHLCVSELFLIVNNILVSWNVLSTVMFKELLYALHVKALYVFFLFDVLSYSDDNPSWRCFQIWDGVEFQIYAIPLTVVKKTTRLVRAVWGFLWLCRSYVTRNDPRWCHRGYLRSGKMHYKIRFVDQHQSSFLTVEPVRFWQLHHFF